MSRSVLEYFEHIKIELDFLKEKSVGLDFNSFAGNDTLVRAFSRSFEIIGEAVKNLPDDIRFKYPEVEWKALAGMRDTLIHHYFGVDYELVWDIIENEIDELSIKIDNIIFKERQSL